MCWGGGLLLWLPLRGGISLVCQLKHPMSIALFCSLKNKHVPLHTKLARGFHTGYISRQRRSAACAAGAAPQRARRGMVHQLPA
jgi:hypothetical protein